MTIRFGVPIVIVAVLAVVGWDVWNASAVRIAVVDGEGRHVEGAALEFFRFEDAAHDASPSRRIGEFAIGSAVLTTLPRGFLDDEALVRLTAPGFGVGFGHVVPGRDRNELELGVATRVAGRVTGPSDVPIPGARVQAFGGGPRGVLLAQSTTGTDGRFAFGDISASVRFVLLRVLKPGFAIVDQEWPIGETDSYDVELSPTRPVTGQLVFGADLATDADKALADHELRVHSLPGVHAATDQHGGFVIDHLPTDLAQFRLLAVTLPEGLTHRKTVVSPGADDVAIEIVEASTVRGRVVNGHNQRGVPNATVYHEHGPHGYELVETDGAGYFTIGRVPPGPVELRAEYHLRKRSRSQPANVAPAEGMTIRPGVTMVTVQGSKTLDVLPGEEPELVVIEIY